MTTDEFAAHLAARMLNGQTVTHVARGKTTTNSELVRVTTKKTKDAEPTTFNITITKSRGVVS